MPTAYIAIPCLDEFDQLPTLLADLCAQTYSKLEVWICVNQPDHWWQDPDKVALCVANAHSLQYLKTAYGCKLTVLDRSSKGLGWKNVEWGVGWARKTLMDGISKLAHPNDIMISLDADTRIKPGYVACVVQAFLDHPKAVGLSAPYEHVLGEDDRINQAIARYEQYMHAYLAELNRCGTIFNFTALGSAMAVPVWAYRKVGGLTPKLSGEDFYFLQKLRKMGPLILTLSEKVYPSARLSTRVAFGTGPALIKGVAGDWASYPFYPQELWNQVGQTIACFPALFVKDVPTPMDDFLKQTLRVSQIWAPLRRNFPDLDRFVHACHERVDGLRILQFLKWSLAGCVLCD